MNRARAALCGLALALGASGAAADDADDPWLALFSHCVGSLSESITAIWARFPGEEHRFAREFTLLRMREMKADPARHLVLWTRGGVSRQDVVSNICAAADSSSAALKALERGDEAAFVELREPASRILGALTPPNVAAPNWLALFSRCVGSLSESITAIWARFPGEEHRFAREFTLLRMREMKADPARHLVLWTRGGVSRQDVVSNICAAADSSSAALKALERGDEAAFVELREPASRILGALETSPNAAVAKQWDDYADCMARNQTVSGLFVTPCDRPGAAPPDR